MTHNRCARPIVYLAALVLVLAFSTVQFAAAQEPAKPPITIAQLAGTWQIAVAGNTGCGVSSILFKGTLNTSGTGTGTFTGSSAGCGSSSTTETFSIISLDTKGNGTAGLTCGSGCGFIFNIQVAKNKQMFNMVDVVDGGSNVLAGTAVKQ